MCRVKRFLAQNSTEPAGKLKPNVMQNNASRPAVWVFEALMLPKSIKKTNNFFFSRTSVAEFQIQGMFCSVICGKWLCNVFCQNHPRHWKKYVQFSNFNYTQHNLIFAHSLNFRKNQRKIRLRLNVIALCSWHNECREEAKKKKLWIFYYNLLLLLLLVLLVKIEPVRSRFDKYTVRFICEKSIENAEVK